MSTAPNINSIRNIIFLSHGGGGKSSLCEALLYNARAISKMGSVGKGEGVMVIEPEEVTRKITITPHSGFFNWKDCHINIIDTPGHINLLEIARSALPAADGAVFLMSAVLGLRPENARLWSMTKDSAISPIIFINEMDGEQADFDKVLAEIEETFDVPSAPLAIPIGKGSNFTGIIDVLNMTAYADKDGAQKKIDIPANLMEHAKEIRHELVEHIAETDDVLLEKYLETDDLTSEELLKGLRKAILQRKVMGILCGSVAQNAGVKMLADTIVELMPNPVERAEVKPIIGFAPLDKAREKEISRKPDRSSPFSAIVFKTTVDPFSGKLSFIRVLSGFQQADQPIYNGTRDEKDKAGHMYKLQGKEMIQVGELSAGDIGIIVKMANVRTGDTLCDMKDIINVPQIKFVEPVLAFAVEADQKAEEKAAAGLTKLAEEDPTIKFFRDENTHEMILAGMGQTHLEITLERLARKFGAKVTLKTQKVPYRETIRRQVRVQGKYKKQSGGHGQYGDCWIEVSPQPRNGGYLFENKIVGGAIPRNYIPSVEKGVIEAMKKGILGGNQVVDVKIALVDGSYHDVDSSDFAFQRAGIMAFKKAMEQADPILLEPVMSLEIIIPEETMGNVIKDLNSRRGRVLGMDPQGANQVIKAEVPMDEVLEYGNVLHALTSGRGIYTMSLSTYEVTPAQIAKKIIDRYQATKGVEKED